MAKPVKDFETALGTLPGKLGMSFLRKAGRKAMKLIQQEASAQAPVDTGLLASSIVIKTKRATDQAIELSIGPSKDTFYGKFVEQGTKHMKPQPFLNPALAAKSPEAAAFFATQLDALIQDHFKT